jgi:hypothetical protein
MAASSGSNMTLIFALIGVLVVAFFLMRRKSGNFGLGSGIPTQSEMPNCNLATQWCTCPGGDSFKLGPNQTCTDCTAECGRKDGVDYRMPLAPGFDPVGGATGPRGFEDQANLVQGTLQFPLSEKVGIPIISGSIDFEDPTWFDELAHGMCQCDDHICCYKAPYQPRRGDINTEMECEGVRYGDVVQACDNAFSTFQDNLSASGIDNDQWINNKVRDRKFFYKMDGGSGGFGGHGRGRHAGSEFYDDAAYLAYANVAAGFSSQRTPTYKAASALLSNTYNARKKSAMSSLVRSSEIARRMRNKRAARKLLR